MRRRQAIVLAISALVCVTLGAMPAMAQYDRDGRYVPSPMGRPTDPFARPIPNYSGTPGAAIGEPILPRGAIGTSPPVVLLPRPPLRTEYRSIEAPPVALTKTQCGEPWSRATRMIPSEFKRRCSLIMRRKDGG